MCEVLFFNTVPRSFPLLSSLPAPPPQRPFSRARAPPYRRPALGCRAVVYSPRTRLQSPNSWLPWPCRAVVYSRRTRLQCWNSWLPWPCRAVVYSLSCFSGEAILGTQRCFLYCAVVLLIFKFLFAPPARRFEVHNDAFYICLLYTSPSPRDRQKSRMPSSA